MSKTVLYDYWRSTASYRVRIALNLAGINYSSVSVDLVDGEQKNAAYLAKNPQGLVPVLEIDGLRLTQSLAILEYLNTTRDLDLLPVDPGSRAKVLALAHAIAVDIHPVCNLRVVTYASSLTEAPAEVRKNWMRRFIGPGLDAVEAMMGSHGQTSYCCGDTPGFVDICLIPQLYNADRWGVDFSHLPHILAAQQACAEHAAFVNAHPDMCKPV
ncbi:MAG: maleylacetoacetate isomerase [Rhodobacteraceae bacterium]|nr:maleylacetoacetate isomerase [Paracoccaceae bacterium]